MTYFDRFLSVYELSFCSLERVDRKWEIQLIAMACLSLAAKLEEANVLSNTNSQAEEQPGFLFEWKTIQRMEILIMNRLDWKIKAYTPCSFIDYYLTKINGGEFPSQAVIDRSLQVIVSTIEGIEFLRFRASEIAAAVAVFVYGGESKDIDNAVSGLIGIEKGKVEKVVEMIKNLSSISGIISANYGPNHWLTRGPRSPNGVLEAALCLTCKTGTVITVESCPSSSRNNKRRKS